MKMNKNGLNLKHIKLLPVIGIFMMISLFLPFLSMKSDKVSVSGFHFITDYLFASGGKGTMLLELLALLIVIPVLLIVILTLVVLLRRIKAVIMSLATVYAISAICFMIVIFSAKKIIDVSKIFSSGFMVSNLGAGFWCLLVLSFVGLVFAMKTARINPGYIVLTVMSVVWLIPIAWVIMISFREEQGSYTSYFWPKHFTLKNYTKLLTDNSQFYFTRWFLNTLFVAICSCALSTIIVLSTSYSLSRLRFKGRRPFMNVALILGMFPGFMSMIAVYYILKGLGLTQTLIALPLVYGGGSALGYYIVKGFFDTIPKALDEAAIIDGASRWKVFTKITIPLSKPVIIYTMLISFISPWGDFIFARIIMGDNYKNYTVAIGLYTMLERENIAKWYTGFAAGAVLVSIPISILFICLQKYYVEGLSGSVKG